MTIDMNKLTEYDKNACNSFIKGHVCPDRSMHDNEKFRTVMWEDWSGIGANLYIRCLRCGCQQDITDYGSW